MEGGDPFAPLTALWHTSSSQEQRLRLCRFAGKPYDGESSSSDSGGTPVASTGIVMVSLPNTPDEKGTDGASSQVDVFHTPPEEPVAAGRHKNGTVVAERNDEEILVADIDSTDDSREVDLGRDTDLAWSLPEESSERNQSALGVDSASSVDPSQAKEVIDSEPMKGAILKRKLGSDDRIGNSPLKKLKIEDKNLPSEVPRCNARVEAERALEIIVKSMEKLKSPSERSEFLDVITGLRTPRGSLDIEAEKALERFVKSVEKLKSPRKFSKLLDKDLASGALSDPLGSNSGKSVETPNSGVIGFRNDGSRSHEEILAEVNDGDREFHEESTAKRKLKFPVEVLEPDTRENNCGLQINDDRVEGVSNEKESIDANKSCYPIQRCSATKSIDDIDKYRYGDHGLNIHERLNMDRVEGLSHEKEVIEAIKSSYPLERHSAPKGIDEIDKFRYTGPSCLNPHERSNNVNGKRRLPASLCAKGNAGGEERRPPPSVFEVLKMLAQKCYRDPNLESLSLLEAAKRRGMTFP